MPWSPVELVPLLAGLAVVLGVVLPVVRLWLQEGVFAVMPATDSVQRFLHGVFAGTLLGYGVWTSLLSSVGPDALHVWPAPAAVGWAGFGLGVVGLGIVVVAQAQMGASWRVGLDKNPTDLVMHGIYRWSRNPIYLGMLVLVIGVALIAPSPWTIMGAAMTYVLVGFQARSEEVHMQAQHGDAYLAWASKVGRFLPGIGRL